MTTRNLNKTWRDVVFQQYASDHAADVPFPIRYLINAKQWHRDIWIEIPQKVDVRDFRRSVLSFFVAMRHEDPVFDDQNISVRPRMRPEPANDSDDPTEPERAQQAGD
ncbi:hypothetical protein Daus18300_004232 [Diaporthe australafricana]|uniref:Uncharacterized protein n=1 Tax=Diaporthe australafricana TaxID=127596 RepID=A0ABR3X9Q7_9PEZI